MDDLSRLFRIDFYPQDWLVLTGHLTIEQRGMLITICSLIYSRRGPIPNDPAWIAGSGCSSRMARALIQQLVDTADIYVTEDGKIGQKRCEKELNLLRTRLEHSAKGGRTRAERISETKEINDVASSDTHVSPRAPSTTTPLYKEDTPNGVSKKERGSRLPPNWILPLSWGQYAIDKGLTEQEIRHEAELFANHWWAQPGQRGVKLDWLATWRKWVLTELERKNEKHRGNRGNRPNVSDQAIELVLAKQRSQS